MYQERCSCLFFAAKYELRWFDEQENDDNDDNKEEEEEEEEEEEGQSVAQINEQRY